MPGPSQDFSALSLKCQGNNEAGGPGRSWAVCGARNSFLASFLTVLFLNASVSDNS